MQNAWRWWVVAVAQCGAVAQGCGDSGTGGRERGTDTAEPSPTTTGDPAKECNDGTSKSCACPEGTGYARCVGGTYEDCDCSLATAKPDAGGSLPAMRLEHCEPGVYVGNFACDYTGSGVSTPTHVEGPVQFTLEIDETRVMDQNCDEFCTDLVISEGSGKLFGFANLIIGFECTLQGGLDCTTGEFRAMAVNGQYGLPTSSNPNDPMAPATVAQPPWGTFDGTLDGTHNGMLPETIAGDWALNAIMQGGTCSGPFTVERMP